LYLVKSKLLLYFFPDLHTQIIWFCTSSVNVQTLHHDKVDFAPTSKN
jgi:hypothetical protein